MELHKVLAHGMQERAVTPNISSVQGRQETGRTASTGISCVMVLRIVTTAAMNKMTFAVCNYSTSF